MATTKSVQRAKIEIRVFAKEDLEQVVRVDRKITGRDHSKYYERKLQHLRNKDQINTCQVAVLDGQIVGFLMGYVYYGEYGIPESTASIDTLGVAEAFRGQGIAQRLFEHFARNMKALGVEKIYTLVDWSQWDLLGTFQAWGFSPSSMLNLEKDLRPYMPDVNLEPFDQDQN
ncbi:MAG: GNAT family N-acetyltransferase [Acidobacteria bacterium]|nr:GNAT family N-acetyltransferase [Acidobacteriota bacterium]